MQYERKGKEKKKRQHELQDKKDEGKEKKRTKYKGKLSEKNGRKEAEAKECTNNYGKK